MEALVTDGNQRVALEIVRCLGRRGVDVEVVEKNSVTSPLAFASRYATRCTKIETYSGTEFQKRLRESEALFPVSTNTHLKLYNLDTDLQRKCLLPSRRIFRKANNKLKMIQLADELEIPAPETSLFRGERENLSEVEVPEFPVVVKYRDDEGLYLKPAERYRKVDNRDQLEQTLNSFEEQDRDFLFQEYIPGTGAGFSFVYDDSSQAVAGIGHRRLRELPPGGGPSTYCESIRDRQLQSSTLKLLNRLDWRGPAMVEFRLDSRDGSYKLMEVNPRYWGSLPLARSADLNLPYLHYQLLSEKNQASPEKTSGQTGSSSGDKQTTPEDQPLIAPAGRKMKLIFPDLVSRAKATFTNDIEPTRMIDYLKEWWASDLSFGIYDREDPGPFRRYFFQNLAEII